MRHGSKMIARTLEEAGNAASLAFELAPVVGAYWAKEIAPDLNPGRAAPDVGELMRLYGRKIEYLREKLSVAHHARHQVRVREMHKADFVREAAVKLRHLLADVRFLLDRTFGTRVGAANFEGRDDLQRIPLHRLERTSTLLLKLLSDKSRDWRERDHGIEVSALRTKLAAAIEELRQAQAEQRTAKSSRAQAAGEAGRISAADESALRRTIFVIRRLLESAGLDHESKTLRRKRRKPRRGRQVGQEKKGRLVFGAPTPFTPTIGQGAEAQPQSTRSRRRRKRRVRQPGR